MNIVFIDTTSKNLAFFFVQAIIPATNTCNKIHQILVL